MGAYERSFEETCAKWGIGLLVGGGFVVGIIMAFEIGFGRVDAVVGGTLIVVILTTSVVLFLGKVKYLVELK